MTNWKAMQAPTDKNKKLSAPRGVYPRYLAAGSRRADLSKGGVLRPKRK
jgi:hypothetical protein